MELTNNYQLRIVTDGEFFEVEYGSIHWKRDDKFILKSGKIHKKGLKLELDGYTKSDNIPFGNWGKLTFLNFKSKKEAEKWIKEEYGDEGLKRL